MSFSKGHLNSMISGSASMVDNCSVQSGLFHLMIYVMRHIFLQGRVASGYVLSWMGQDCGVTK